MANFLFFGTPLFAELVLQELIKKGLRSLAVVTNPDKPTGRKLILTPPPVKVLAEANGIKVFQPENLSEIRDELSRVDFAVVAAYAKIIPADILTLSRLGFIGVHPSLLPKYRGSSPIQNAILSQENETGVSLYLMDEKMDHGSILSQKTAIISAEDTTEGLTEKLGTLGGQMLAELIPNYIDGKVVPVPQDESLATYTKKFSRTDAFIPPADILNAQTNFKIARQVNAKVRAFTPEPGAWTFAEAFSELHLPSDKNVKILESAIQNGGLKISKIQVEGKMAISI